MKNEAYIIEARRRIGARLLFLRKEKGLNQDQVAHTIGVTNWTIGKVEAGRYNVGIDVITGYCAVLGRTFESLWE